jgi:ubiquinone/menaquinone biosynthesis C-methylase UbiE
MSGEHRYSNEPEDGGQFTASFDRAYSRFAGAYDIAVKCLPVWKAWLRHALPHLQGPRVLEVSFGTGYLLTQYGQRFEVHGIDLNRQMVRTARRNLSQRGVPADLLQANVEALPYRDATFDCVVNTMALSGYPDASAAMSEICRVLKPGGRLVLIDVNYPRTRSRLGTQLTELWKRGGDLIRDIDALLTQFAFEYTREEIGGFGSVQLYVARRR